ncbi:hypothetical protein [Alicyclobacillus sp. SO9]|uniref:hypothetical protein n=1 Tax=Alicyclobacillus sp. SO9 TaxID=2665646 RepID=UPI0018E70E06|nr:hypothetical protein [Alicyclobacillus sp. SO9]QQE80461.1 hypothetical protein GI364_08635 [Alicyclobacillus sp. SO9]
MQRMKYDCTCGWQYEGWLGIHYFVVDPYRIVERQIRTAANIHANLLQVWSELLDHPLMVEESTRVRSQPIDVPSFLKPGQAQGSPRKPLLYLSWELGHCSECSAIVRNMLAYLPSHELMHPVLCPQCGNETVTLYGVPKELQCPECQEAVAGKSTGIA